MTDVPKIFGSMVFNREVMRQRLSSDVYERLIDVIENGGEMTEPQLEECATMRCTCDDAKLYQETANRRGTAKQRAQELFGENAGEYKQTEAILALIDNAIDLVCDKELKQVTITIRTGLNCRIMQMAKDKIKIVRETSNAEAFEQ